MSYSRKTYLLSHRVVWCRIVERDISRRGCRRCLSALSWVTLTSHSLSTEWRRWRRSRSSTRQEVTTRPPRCSVLQCSDLRSSCLHCLICTWKPHSCPVHTATYVTHDLFTLQQTSLMPCSHYCKPCLPQHTSLMPRSHCNIPYSWLVHAAANLSHALFTLQHILLMTCSLCSKPHSCSVHTATYLTHDLFTLQQTSLMPHLHCSKPCSPQHTSLMPCSHCSKCHSCPIHTAVNLADTQPRSQLQRVLNYQQNM